MKYIRGTQTYKLDDLPKEKLRLHVNDQEGEGIWVAQAEDHCVLLNDSLSLFPFRSWGLILPVKSTDSDERSSYDLAPMLAVSPDDTELTVHPEAWDQMLAKGAIDKDGVFNDDSAFFEEGEEEGESGPQVITTH